MAKPNLTLSLPSMWRVRPTLRRGKLAVLLALGGLLLFAFLVGPRLLVPTEPGLVVERIGLPTRELLVARVRNVGSAPLTIAQVQVDSAYWTFRIASGPTVGPRATAIVEVPYLWVQNEPHTMTFVTSTGATFSGQIASATLDSGASGWTRWLVLSGGMGVLAMGGWLTVLWMGRIGARAGGRREVALVSLLLAVTLLGGVGGLTSLFVR